MGESTKKTLNSYLKTLGSTAIPLKTELSKACHRGCEETVQKVLDEKADADKLSELPWGALLSVAVFQDHDHIVERLLTTIGSKVAGININDDDNGHADHDAGDDADHDAGDDDAHDADHDDDHDAVYDGGIDADDDGGSDGRKKFSRVLIEACKRGRVGMVEKLLTMPGIDVNEEGLHGLTPLLIACHRGDVDIVQTLLAMTDIDVNKCDISCKRTPLFAACCNSHRRDKDTEKIVALLLKHRNIDIDVEFTSHSGEPYTPLWMAEKTCGPSSDTVQLLRLAKQKKRGVVGVSLALSLREGNQNNTAGD